MIKKSCYLNLLVFIFNKNIYETNKVEKEHSLIKHNNNILYCIIKYILFNLIVSI